MRTDFFNRSFDTGRHEAYYKLVDKVMSTITDPASMATYSSPEQIAEVVYEAATDEKIRFAMSLKVPKPPMRCVCRLAMKHFAKP